MVKTRKRAKKEDYLDDWFDDERDDGSSIQRNRIPVRIYPQLIGQQPRVKNEPTIWSAFFCEIREPNNLLIRQLSSRQSSFLDAWSSKHGPLQPKAGPGCPFEAKFWWGSYPFREFHSSPTDAECLLHRRTLWRFRWKRCWDMKRLRWFWSTLNFGWWCWCERSV